MARTKKTEIETIPAGENTALSHDPEARMIAERVLALKEETKWDLPVSRGKPLNGEALQEWLLKKEEQSAIASVERGVCYALLKLELGHGALEGWLKDNGISPRSSRFDRQVARLYLELSAANRKRVADLPQRKLAPLAGAPALLVDDLFDSGALDNADQMSVEQLRELVKLRKEVERQSERENRLNGLIAEQDEELRKRRALPETQQYLLEMRRTVLEELEAIRANAHTLQGMMDKITILPKDLPPHELDAIIHPLMFGLQGLHATVTALLDRGYDRYENYYPDIGVMAPGLSEEEVTAATQRHAEFLAAADRRASFRQMDLAPAPKRRGRKPATTKKRK